jgi:hypothetical protein
VGPPNNRKEKIMAHSFVYFANPNPKANLPYIKARVLPENVPAMLKLGAVEDQLEAAALTQDLVEKPAVKPAVKSATKAGSALKKTFK